MTDLSGAALILFTVAVMLFEKPIRQHFCSNWSCCRKSSDHDETKSNFDKVKREARIAQKTY